ncbi:hypothetical protein Skr01_15150 [Sphaerisporangium krabiense]|nr:hypothetical protein Skr01_15150 [Sphaerisporangium krabiense]
MNSWPTLSSTLMAASAADTAGLGDAPGEDGEDGVALGDGLGGAGVDGRTGDGEEDARGGAPPHAAVTIAIRSSATARTGPAMASTVSAS